MNSQLATLNQLLENFFSQQTKDRDKTQASRNLTNFSQNQDFLDVALTLISAYEVKDNQLLLLFIMIKDKFRYDFELIDSQKITNYYEILCELASKFKIRSKTVFTNISQSLALIYLNQIAIRDFSLTDFLKRFQTEDPTQLALYNYYFKIIEQCAVYATSSKVVLDEESRKAISQRLISQQLQVIQILNQSVESVWYSPLISQVVQKVRIISCFASWIDLHYDPKIYNSLHTTSLLQEVVNCLICWDQLKGQTRQIESAVQCLKSIIQRIKSPQQNSQLYSYLGGVCFKLIDFIDEKIAKGHVQDVEELISLVVFFSQKFALFLVNTYSECTKKFLMSLIKYMNTGLPKVVECLIQFWQKLLDLFNTAKEQKKLSAELKMDLPMTLLHVLVQKCAYTPQLIQQLDTLFQYKLSSQNQQAEQIFDNRVLAQDCFDGLAQLLGTNNYIGYIVQNISELNLQDKLFFSYLQAYLFALIPSLKKLNMITQDVEVLIQTYQHLIKNVNPIRTGVKRTFLKAFKAIFSIKIQDYKLIQKLYYFTIECLSDNMLADIAARTFSKACENNPRHLYSMIVEISGLVKNHPFEDQIIKGYIWLASYDKNTASFLIQDCLEYLVSHAKYDFLDILRSKQCVHTLTSALKAIRDCSFEGKKQLLQRFIKLSWDFILATLKSPQSYTQDQDIKIQRIVKLLKTIMRILKQDFKPYLSQLFTTAIQAFKKYPICSYVYLVQVAVTVYSSQKNQEIQFFLKEVYEKFLECSFQHLQRQKNIDVYSFLIDDFLGMNSRLLIYNTKVIVSSKHFPNLIRFITEDCLKTETNKAIKATYSFLHTLFMIYWSDQFVQAYNEDSQEDGKEDTISIQPKIIDQSLYIYLNEYLKGEIPGMIKRMLQHLASIPSQSTKDQILDTLLSQIKAFPDVNPQIWKQLLSEISPNILLQVEKEQFIFLMQCVRSQFDNFKKVNVWVKQLNRFLNLINKRMVLADKRRRINVKD